MDRQLDRWLKRVWKDRKLILLMSGYNMEREKHKVIDADNCAVQYVKDLIDNSKVRETAADDGVIDQFCESIMTIADRGNLRVDLQGPEWIANVNLALLYKIQPSDLKGRRFHFRKTADFATHQVFINFKEQHRVNAFDTLCYETAYVSGLCTMIIAAPGMQRTNPVEFQTRDQDSQRDVVDYVRALYRDHKEWFDHPVPALTRRVDRLTGVSTAMIPPDVRIAKVQRQIDAREYQQTFYGYRAMIVVQALIDTKERKLERASRAEARFRELVTQYLHQFGVQAHEPSTQGSVTSAADMARTKRLHRRMKHAVWQYNMGGGVGPPPVWGNPPRSGAKDYPGLGNIF